MSEVLDLLDELRREGEALLRELELALMRGHLANQAPSQTVSPFEGRLRDLDRRLERAASEHPHTGQYVGSLRETIRSRFEALVEHAKSAYQQRGLVEPGLAARYNQALGEGLSYAPQAGRQFVEHQLDGVVRSVVDTVVNHPQIPGHVRGEIAQALAGWIKQQEHSQEALYAIEGALFEVARFLHEGLSLHTQIVGTRDQVTRQGEEVHAQLVCQADQRVGQLAQRCRDSEAEVAQRIETAVTRVQPYFRLEPRLVLDPARAFLASLQAQAGIRISQGDVRVDLNTRIKVTNPTDPSGLAINPSLQITSGDLGIGAGASSGYDPASGQWQHEFRVELRWSF